MTEEENNEETTEPAEGTEPRVEGELGVTEGLNADGDIEVDVTEVETTTEDGQVAEVDVVESETVIPADAPEEPGVAEAAEESEAVEEAIEEAVAEEGIVEDRSSASDDDAPAASGSDQAPGADLEPISLEPEIELTAEERAALEAEEEERAALEEEGAEEAPVAKPAPAKLAKDARYIATGKRKRSVARVIVLPGTGKIEVNGRDVAEYFPRARHRVIINSPLELTGYESLVDVRVRVHGGGISGQAGAVRHGIAKSFLEIDPELRGELKRRGFLTRDSRAKERRKAGLKKARKRPQFSKR